SLGRSANGYGFLSRRRRRVRYPARRQPHEARRQDLRSATSYRQLRQTSSRGNDCLRSDSNQVTVMSDIDIRQITKRLREFTGVDGVTFSVEHGEIFGLLRPNGAGKSTLIRMLTTLLPATSGTARVNGFDVFRESDSVRQSIDVIPQAMTSDLELSVEENL